MKDIDDNDARIVLETLGPERVKLKAKQWTSGGKKKSTANTEGDLFLMDTGTAANEQQRGAGASPVAPQSPDVTLTPEAKTILEALANESGMTVTQEALADVTRLSLPTVRKNLNYLRNNGLIHRPHGERKGDTITDTGRDLLRRG